MPPTDPDPDAWANAVRQALRDVGWSLDRLGDALGVRKQSVGRWLTEPAPPPPPVVFAIEAALEVEPGSLSAHLGYVPAGLAKVDGVAAALRADDQLSARDKRTVLNLYRSLAGLDR